MGETTIEFVGICSGRKLRVSLKPDSVVVESLSGSQAGTVFTHSFDELKNKADLVVDQSTPRHSGGWVVGILAAILCGACALHWGEGITIPVFWASLVALVVATLVVKSAPKRKTFLWSTKSGNQVFGLEENDRDKDDLHRFIDRVEASIRSSRERDGK